MFTRKPFCGKCRFDSSLELLGSAPLNLLLTLPEAGMEREETDAVISDFLSQSLSCLNLCGRRMRALCKKPSDVYSKLEDQLRALGLGGVLDSSGVAKDAAQVRKDLGNAMGGGSQQYCRGYSARILFAGSAGTCRSRRTRAKSATYP